MYEKCPPHLNIVLTLGLPCENKTSHFILSWCALRTSPAASSMVWSIKFIKYIENKLIVTNYVQNVRLWHEHKHTRVLGIGQLHHQSATAPSCTTHALDAVAAHRFHELWSDLIHTLGDFTIWISLSLSLFAQSKIRTERKLNQKLKSIFCSDSVRTSDWTSDWAKDWANRLVWSSDWARS